MKSIPILPFEPPSSQPSQNTSPETGESGQFQAHFTSAKQQQEQSKLGKIPENLPTSQADSNLIDADITVDKQPPLDNPDKTKLPIQNQFVQLIPYPLTQNEQILASWSESSDVSPQYSAQLNLAQLFPQNNKLADILQQNGQKADIADKLAEFIKQTGRKTITADNIMDFLQQTEQKTITIDNLKDFLQQTEQKTITTKLLDSITNRVNLPQQSNNTALTPPAHHKIYVEQPAGQLNKIIPTRTAIKTNNTVSFHENITIEKWSATFSNQDWVGKSITINSHGSLTPQTQPQGSESQSQLISVFQTPESAELTPGLFTTTSGETNSFNGIRQDLTNQYIHSNLPNAIEGEENNTQNNSAGNNEQQQGKEDNLLAAQKANHSSKLTEGSSLFSLEPQNSQILSSSSLTSGTTGLRYPPGFELQENQIVNQVVERFNINRQLETGTITLRLQPEELGKLKLEIKVERDSIRAHIIAANPQVQDILERNVPKLREALSQMGLQLEQLEVTVAASDKDNSQPFNDRPQNKNFHHHPAHSISISTQLNQLQDFEYNSEAVAPQGLSVLA